MGMRMEHVENSQQILKLKWWLVQFIIPFLAFLFNFAF